MTNIRPHIAYTTVRKLVETGQNISLRYVDIALPRLRFLERSA